MTYSLNTLNNSRRAAAVAAGRRRPLRPRIRAGAAALVALVFWLLALVTYSAAGRRVLHLGQRRRRSQLGRAPGRLAGRRELFPARVFGVVVLRRGRARLAGHAGALDARRAAPARTPQRFRARRLAFWVRSGRCCCARARRWNGRACTASSRGCPTTRAARSATLVGPLGVKWLGFTGSGLVFVALVVLGSRAGLPLLLGPRRRAAGRADRRPASSRAAKSARSPQDLALGQQAARQREEVLLEERIEIEEHHPAPVLIEPVMVEVPKQRARRQGTAEAALHRAARLQAAAGRPARWRRRRGRRRCRPKRWR